MGLMNGRLQNRTRLPLSWPQLILRISTREGNIQDTTNVAVENYFWNGVSSTLKRRLNDKKPKSNCYVFVYKQIII